MSSTSTACHRRRAHFAGGTWNVLIDHASFDVELEVATGNRRRRLQSRSFAVRSYRSLEDERKVRMRMTSALRGDRNPHDDRADARKDRSHSRDARWTSTRATARGHGSDEDGERAARADGGTVGLVSVGQTVDARAELISIE